MTTSNHHARTRRETDPQSPTSVWYFIGAVFAFTLPNMLFDDFGGWPRILFLTLGLIVMVAGFVQLRREFRAKSRRAESPRRGG
ncbi:MULTISPECIES: hypothetical protein [unclassified Brevibacterium]|uniref:hypothetical protein n=1 Tax=unclassified Brevibacterium TaxID=2614124 RepID=UPI0010805C61|nr:hypothetical protein [Brevibacterium sp. S111]TGD13781.1 hypothetical protein EB836_01995 [Brevibacterium sp. S111]